MSRYFASNLDPDQSFSHSSRRSHGCAAPDARAVGPEPRRGRGDRTRASRVRGRVPAAPGRAVRRRDADLPRPRHREGPRAGDAAPRDVRVGQLRAGLEPARVAVPHPHQRVHQRLSQAPPPPAVRDRAPGRRAGRAVRPRPGPHRRPRGRRCTATSCATRSRPRSTGSAPSTATSSSAPTCAARSTRTSPTRSHVPIGTVMSRLFRARRVLETELAGFAARDYGIKRAA